MENFYLYILKSEKEKRFYIGITENIDIRVKKHNNGSVRSTKFYKPWKLFYSEKFRTKREAREREIFLKKSYKARKDIIDTASSSNG